MELMTNFIELFLDSAPWLLIGLLFAGILKSFIPMAWLHQQLGSNQPSTILKAALFGAPLPLCSCGVIPAAIGLRRAGASKPATAAFLVSTPETGIDSISVSYAMLGPFMAIIRPIAAVTSALAAGFAVAFLTKEDVAKSLNATQTIDPSSKSQCCTKTPKQTQVKTREKNDFFWHKLISGFKFSTSNLVRDISLWLLLGLFFAALIQTYVPTSFLSEWGNGLMAMLIMVLISIPMYICATASTPIAVALLLSGISPGAVLVFMLAGPATNIATLGVIYNELGQRSLIGYLLGVLSGALLFGWFTDLIIEKMHLQISPQIGHEHQLLPPYIAITTGVLLALLMLKEEIKRIGRLINTIGK